MRLLLTLADCAPGANPVSPSYPCGTRGLVCSTAPLSCCWQGDECTADGYCRPASTPYLGASAHKQWRP